MQIDCGPGEALVVMPFRIHYGVNLETNVSESFPWQPEVEDWIAEYSVCGLIMCYSCLMHVHRLLGDAQLRAVGLTKSSMPRASSSKPCKNATWRFVTVL